MNMVYWWLYSCVWMLRAARWFNHGTSTFCTWLNVAANVVKLHRTFSRFLLETFVHVSKHANRKISLVVFPKVFHSLLVMYAVSFSVTLRQVKLQTPPFSSHLHLSQTICLGATDCKSHLRLSLEWNFSSHIASNHPWPVFSWLCSWCQMSIPRHVRN